jgi:hypothetical protein
MSIFKGMRNTSSNFTVFGIPVMFADYERDILVFEPVLDKR